MTLSGSGRASQARRDSSQPEALLEDLPRRFREVRRFTEHLVEPLEPEDCVVQTMADVSPAKWHLAHTSWFFESFILRQHQPSYQPLSPQYDYLFNSYYNAVGPMHCRDRRGFISRPTVSETMRYRAHVGAAMTELLDDAPSETFAELEPLITLGLHHEQQHQELLLTDIKHVFSQNPILPMYRPRAEAVSKGSAATGLKWIHFDSGVRSIGHSGEGFSYDNELPRHRVFLEPFALASQPVTNGEFLEFVEDGGYEKPEFWLSLGWQTVRQNNWRHPLYWTRNERGDWRIFTLAGQEPLDLAAPVCHLSYFEAAAYARWAGARLPTEAEWEIASETCDIEGNFVESGALHPSPAPTPVSCQLQRMFGDVWEWTQSAYLPYPGYNATRDALGEYNGKFMCGQMSLRGGSCATSKSHIRRTYRNFFMPDKQWQFTGLRLAQDI